MKSGTSRLVIAVSLLVAAFCLCPSDAQADGNVFSGRIVDEDGTPIPGVKVVVSNHAIADGPVAAPTRWETTSAADGTFTLRGLGPGANTVAFSKEGFLYRSVRFDLSSCSLYFLRSGAAKEDVLIRMKRPEFVSGIVIDESGDPVAGATVIAWDYTDTTAADGSFKIPAPVPQAVTVTAPGYWWRPAGRLPDAPEPWTIRLTKGPVVGGRVLDAATEKPVEGARLFHRGMQETAVSGPDGRYQLDHLHDSSPDVLVWKDDLIAAMTYDLYDSKSLDAADVQLEKGGTIEGRITEKETGQPLEGIPVSVCGLDPGRGLFARQTTTGPDGRYRISGVLPGNMNVVPDRFTAFAVTWGTCVCAHVEPGEIVAGVDVEIDRPLDPKLVPCIAGQVADDKGEPVPCAVVHVFDRDGRRVCDVRTDITGEFSTATMTHSGQPLVLQADTPYDIEVEDALLAPRRLEGIVIPAETNVRRLSVTLHKGSCVGGTVRDTDGKPVANISLLACPADAASVSGHRLIGRPPRHRHTLPVAVTSPDGTYGLTGLWPGTWMIGILSGECVPTNGPHEIEIEGEKAVGDCDFTVRVFETGSIEGRVVGRRGVPLTHARIILHCDELTVARYAWTDSQGRFRLEALPKLEYNLKAEREDGYSGLVREVEVGASDVVIAARLQEPLKTKTNLVRGRVVNPDGEPIARFEVNCPNNKWRATYHSPSGKFVAYMTRLEAFSVSAPGYETGEVLPDDKAVRGAEIAVVLEPADS